MLGEEPVLVVLGVEHRADLLVLFGVELRGHLSRWRFRKLLITEALPRLLKPLGRSASFNYASGKS